MCMGIYLRKHQSSYDIETFTISNNSKALFPKWGKWITYLLLSWFILTPASPVKHCSKLYVWLKSVIKKCSQSAGTRFLPSSSLMHDIAVSPSWLCDCKTSEWATAMHGWQPRAANRKTLSNSVGGDSADDSIGIQLNRCERQLSVCWAITVDWLSNTLKLADAPPEDAASLLSVLFLNKPAVNNRVHSFD